MMSKVRYIHDEEKHNLSDPSIIVPLIMETLNPRSVVDVGCGIGTFLNVFKKHGVSSVLGIDGKWVNKELLSKYISPDEFREMNLEDSFDIEAKFDLAVCLEVAEHLKEQSADNFVRSLTLLSDTILFSAAIPGQIGQRHINEQWPSYWQKIFEHCGFIFLDVLRPLFWENDQLAVWYKQNMFLAVRNNAHAAEIESKFQRYRNVRIIDYVHPRLFGFQHSEYKKITEGDASLLFYIKLFVKYLLRRLKR